MKHVLLGLGVIAGLGMAGLGFVARSYARNPDGLTDNAGPVALAQQIGTPLLAAGIVLLGLCIWGLAR